MLVEAYFPGLWNEAKTTQEKQMARQNQTKPTEQSAEIANQPSGQMTAKEAGFKPPPNNRDYQRWPSEHWQVLKPSKKTIPW